MAKKLIYALMLYVMSAGVIMAQDLVKQANGEYEKDHYDKAIELYEKAASQYGTSSELYYNIANAHYRLGNIGEAMLYYERALQLDPNNADARSNLDFVNEKANIKLDGGESFFSDTFSRMVMGRSSNQWATIAVVMFLLFVVALLAYIFMQNVTIRKIGFFGGGLLLVLFVVTLSFAFITRSRSVNSRYAIVVVPSSTLSTSPRVPKDKSEEAFLLNEGFKVEVVDSVTGADKDSAGAGKWYDVKTADEHRAWIKSTDVKII
ncbi:MAG: tetratricopeptide repeat protein [Muribaculaceae bacterium]